MNIKRKSIFRDIYYHPYKNKFFKYSRIAKDDESFLQRLGLVKKLPIHQGCVNTICWNDTGEYILSGSDDQHLIVTNGHNYKVEANYCTSHSANIFSAKFLPYTNDKQIISCSGDGIILHTDLMNPQETYGNQFNCHNGTTYEIITIPNQPNTFLSCGEDGTVRSFDLRVKSSCNKTKCREDIIIEWKKAITALAVSPCATHQLAVGCADSTVRIYDRRFLNTDRDRTTAPFCTFIAPHLEDHHYRITSLSYNSNGQDMLVSYSSDYLYLFNIQENQVKEFKKPLKYKSPWEKVKALTTKHGRITTPIRRLRLRGDWSDTGPDARPERDTTTTYSIGQARPHLQDTLMQRMTDVLSRMLNDPMTRAALSAGGEDSLDPDESAQRMPQTNRSEGDDASQVDNAPQSDIIAPPVDSAALTESSPQTECQATTSNGANQNTPTADAIDETANKPPNENPSSSMSTSEQISDQPSTSNTNIEQTTGEVHSQVSNDLHNHLAVLRDLREGFIEHHGSEPSVSFKYSQQSTSKSTISLRCNTLDRPNIVPESATGVSNVPSNTNLQDFMNNSSDGADTESDMELDFEDDSDILFSPFKKTDNSSNSTFEAHMKMKYVGHRNARTMIKEATFWGEDYVMSGSDCGHIFVWEKNTGKLKMLLQADQHVVNCLQPHPTLPLLATSGIDHDIKLWAPILEEPCFDAKMAEDLINRNAIMLEETRDTITVPAAFMIRMLTFLNQIPRGSQGRGRRREETD